MTDPAPLAPTTAPAPARAPQAHRALPWIVFLVSLAAFELVWGRRFYTSLTHVGHDFSLAGVALLEGRNWLDANGWFAGWFTPPWFTPAWCAGTAFYLDPQSVFYSPLQLLTRWFDPFQATHLNTLLFGAVAYWGGYALARKVFAWAVAPAAVFGLIGMANAFVPMRSAVGEVGYQPLYLWTLLALALCWPAREGRWRLFMPAIGVCLTLTAWLQFGFAGMMVPAFLATLTLCLVAVLRGRVPLFTLIARSALGGVLAIVLNVAKLYESAALMRNFPRDFYGIPGFPSLGDALAAIVFALVQPSEWTMAFASPRLSNVQFTALPHEWALNFGWGALALAVLAGIVLLVLRQRRQAGDASAAPGAPAPTVTPAQGLALLGLALILVLPVLLLWNQGAVQAFIKQVPILSSTAWPMRWIVIYLPLAQLLLAWPLYALLRARPGWWAAGSAAALALVWAGPATEPVSYYLSDAIQSYDPKPVMTAFQRSRWEGPRPIKVVTVPPPGSGLPADRNDTMLEGASQAHCYNPIYGYRLEGFPQLNRLREGPALEDDGAGQSLLLNPACLVHPTENACKPGDGFKLADARQRRNAELFLARKPFEWQRPALGHTLALVSQASVALLSVLLAGWLLRALWRASAARRASRPPRPD